jgi:hypothetical protein
MLQCCPLGCGPLPGAFPTALRVAVCAVPGGSGNRVCATKDVRGVPAEGFPEETWNRRRAALKNGPAVRERGHCTRGWLNTPAQAAAQAEVAQAAQAAASIHPARPERKGLSAPESKDASGADACGLVHKPDASVGPILRQMRRGALARSRCCRPPVTGYRELRMTAGWMLACAPLRSTAWLTAPAHTRSVSQAARSDRLFQPRRTTGCGVLRRPPQRLRRRDL